MSNLGAYQIMTTVAKKVGGPKILCGLTMCAGYLVIRPGEALVKQVFRATKIRKDQSVNEISNYTVLKSGEFDSLVFEVGEELRILEIDEDAVVIERVNIDNNPYVISVDFLKEISNYK